MKASDQHGVCHNSIADQEATLIDIGKEAAHSRPGPLVSVSALDVSSPALVESGGGGGGGGGTVYQVGRDL